MTDVLSRRELNRATLARQHLLERAPAGALDTIEHLAGMQSQALRQFAQDGQEERTGLLREVSGGQIQFVHRTCRDYLAAKEVVDSGDLGLLIDHAHLDQWHDVVIMAVAHARPIERERILAALLEGNAAARERGAVHDRLLRLTPDHQSRDLSRSVVSAGGTAWVGACRGRP